jgi:hypothetical protein
MREIGIAAILLSITILLIGLTAFANSVQELEDRANTGDREALYTLGVSYSLGFGVKKDKSKAKSYFLQAADKGHADAQYELGKIFKETSEDKSSAESAIYWLKRAAKNNHIRAQYLLGYIYENGEMINVDYKKAIHYYPFTVIIHHA